MEEREREFLEETNQPVDWSQKLPELIALVQHETCCSEEYARKVLMEKDYDIVASVLTIMGSYSNLNTDLTTDLSLYYHPTTTNTPNGLYPFATVTDLAWLLSRAKLSGFVNKMVAFAAEYNTHENYFHLPSYERFSYGYLRGMENDRAMLEIIVPSENKDECSVYLPTNREVYVRQICEEERSSLMSAFLDSHAHFSHSPLVSEVGIDGCKDSLKLLESGTRGLTLKQLVYSYAY